MNRLLALSTVYGVEALNAACLEMLKDGIIGIEKLERYLRVENVAMKNPEPMKFNREKLNRVIPGTSLSSYDELLIKDDSTTSQGESDGN